MPMLDMATSVVAEGKVMWQPAAATRCRKAH
jgi:hypothetical protein